MKKQTHPVTTVSNRLSRGKLIWIGLATALVIAVGCKKTHDAEEHGTKQRTVESLKLEDDTTLSLQTRIELKQARAVTARYEVMSNALADGYADINVVRQNMGFHLMRSALVDSIFDPLRPELLVYNKMHNGEIQLVAVEYAVPIELRPNEAPAGFTGNADVWKRDTDFGLWLLHAWVWEYNPEGVFNPTNPLVHLH